MRKVKHEKLIRESTIQLQDMIKRLEVIKTEIHETPFGMASLEIEKAIDALDMAIAFLNEEGIG